MNDSQLLVTCLFDPEHDIMPEQTRGWSLDYVRAIGDGCSMLGWVVPSGYPFERFADDFVSLDAAGYAPDFILLSASSDTFGPTFDSLCSAIVSRLGSDNGRA